MPAHPRSVFPLWRRTRGQAMVETAFVFLIALLILGAILDLGRAYYFSVSVVAAAREGARLAADGGVPVSEVEAAVRNAAGDVTIDAVTVSPADRTASAGLPVRVTATHNFRLVFPAIAALAPGPLPITGSASMVVQ